MRIMHVTHSAENITLGIERETTNLAMAQQARGFEVIIVIDRPGIFAELCEEHDISVIMHSGLGGRRIKPGPPDEKNVNDFIALLENYKPDVIHCHSGHASVIVFTAGNRAGIPCVFTADSPESTIQLLKRGLRFATVCLTEASLGSMRKGTQEIEAYYVPNGTRVLPQVAAPQTGNGNHPVNLLLAGNLVDRKGCDIAIMAMFDLRRRLGESCPVLNIYGDGPRKDYLTEMSTVLGMNDNVRFHGFRLGILEQCPSTDMLIMPSRHESCPLVVIEAMSRGMPIVATDVGDVTNMIPDQRYGRVVPPDSVLPLAEAIESLLQDVASGQFDPDLLIERHRSLYSFEKWAERMEAVYDEAGAGSRRVAAAPHPR
jgi:glycosyltransferase involved in cell wall biosynthesis